MKKITVLIFFSMFSRYLISQNITGVVYYNLTVLSDTLHDVELTQKASLYFDIEEKKSLYVTRRENNNEIRKPPKVTAKKDGSLSIKNTQLPFDKIGEITYKNHKVKELICRDFISDKPFIVLDEYPDVKWDIKSEQKNILGFSCQKAEGDFRGRHYIAWFTDKIPIPDGPWKLCGLPGLILEVFDKKKYIHFELQSVELPKLFDEIIQAPTEGESIKFIDFYKKNKESAKEALKRFLANTGNLDANVSVSGGIVEATQLERNIQE